MDDGTVKSHIFVAVATANLRWTGGSAALLQAPVGPPRFRDAQIAIRLRLSRMLRRSVS